MPITQDRFLDILEACDAQTAIIRAHIMTAKIARRSEIITAAVAQIHKLAPEIIPQLDQIIHEYTNTLRIIENEDVPTSYQITIEKEKMHFAYSGRKNDRAKLYIKFWRKRKAEENEEYAQRAHERTLAELENPTPTPTLQLPEPDYVCGNEDCENYYANLETDTCPLCNEKGKVV